MSNVIVEIDGLSDAIKAELDKVNLEVIEGVNKAAQKAATSAVKELRATSPKRSDGKNRKVAPGSYAKGWTQKKEQTGIGVVTHIVHNSKYPGLPHLLEFGHVNKMTGTRGWVGARPHIATANQNAADLFIREVEKIEL